MDLAWPWVAAVAAGWPVLELIAWLRRAPERPALGPWLADRARRHWSLALILALPGLLGSINEGTMLAGLGLVLLVWAIAPDGGGDRRLTDPLRAVGRALRGLRRSPWLVVGLIVCWLMSAAINNLMVDRWRARTSAEGGPTTSDSSDSMSLIRPSMLVNRGPEGAENASIVERLRAAFSIEVDEMLPGMRELVVGFWPYTLLGLALLATLLWARRTRPPWIGEGLLSRTGWPANLLAAMLIVGAVTGWRQFEGLMFGSVTPLGSLLRGGLNLLEGLLIALVIAPLAAMEWRVVLQVARGERWDLRRALPSAIESWAPIALLSVVAALPFELASLLNHLGMCLRLGWSLGWLFELQTPVGLLLALAPWIIVDRGVSFREALAESYRLAVAAGPALVVFVLRYLALFTVGFALVTALGAVPDPGGRAMATAQMLLGDALTVLMTLAVGAYYLHLRQEPAVPAAKMEA